MLSPQFTAEDYASDSDDGCERWDSLTLPAPWRPAAATRGEHHREAVCHLPPRDPREAAGPAWRRPDSPRWGSGRQTRRSDDQALLAAAVAASAVVDRVSTDARSRSTGDLVALVQPADSRVDGYLKSSSGKPIKLGSWLQGGKLAAGSGTEPRRVLGKYSSAPDFGEGQSRIRAHRPSEIAPGTFSLPGF